MKKKLLLIIFFTICNLSGFSQGKIIEGVIIDNETGEPINGVIVYLHVSGTPTKSTNANGKFSFDQNDKIDLHAQYRMTFYKPNYKNKTEFIRFPIIDKITLEKASNGYIQVIDKLTKKLIGGIDVKLQDGKEETTDRFGFFKVNIPTNVDPNKKYRLSIKGGCCYHDEIVDFKAKDLNNDIISIYINPKKFNYSNLINSLDEELNNYYKFLINENIDKQKKHLDKCNEIIRKIESLSVDDLSTEEIEDYKKRIPEVYSLLEDLTKISLSDKKVLESLIDDHRKLSKEFNDGLITLSNLENIWTYPNCLDS